MSFCPRCRSEFRQGVEVCAECGVGLVEELPPEPELVWDSRAWVTVDESGDETQARILEGFLLERGVRARVLQHGDRSFPTSHGGLSRFEVQVSAEELGLAIDLLEAIDDGGDPPEPDGGGPEGSG